MTAAVSNIRPGHLLTVRLIRRVVGAPDTGVSPHTISASMLDSSPRTSIAFGYVLIYPAVSEEHRLAGRLDVAEGVKFPQARYPLTGAQKVKVKGGKVRIAGAREQRIEE